MRYSPSEKLEIIRLVEQSHLPAKRTLDKLGIPRTTFYRWYDRYLAGGLAAQKDKSPKPGRVWNRIPDDIREKVIDMALEEAELSPRELAVRPLTASEKRNSQWLGDHPHYNARTVHALEPSPIARHSPCECAL